MSIILQAKRAAKDNSFYKGETEDLNWEPSHVVMWSRLCNKFGGNFTMHPTRANQTETFLEFLDRYKDKEYTRVNDESAPKTEEVKNPGGHNLRDFIPDRRNVNVQDLSKEDAIKKDAALNQNAIKLTPSLQTPKTPTVKIPDPKKVVENESSAEKSSGNSNNQGSTDGTGETGKDLSKTSVQGSPNGAPIEQTVVEKSASEESNVRNTENIKRGNNEGSKQAVAGGNSQNPFKKAGSNAGTGKPASGSTVKVR